MLTLCSGGQRFFTPWVKGLIQMQFSRDCSVHFTYCMNRLKFVLYVFYILIYKIYKIYLLYKLNYCGNTDQKEPEVALGPQKGRLENIH